MDLDELRRKLVDRGLKVTPQRISVYKALLKMKNHPTAETVAQYVRKFHPSISTGTVYNVLDTLVKNDLIRKVKTDKDIMRYDAVMENHHHIYCEDSERIEDYFDPELDVLLEEYFRKKQISGFKISEIKTQITGKFIRNKTG